MTERQLCAFNRIGHIELMHPGLIKNNINVLSNYKIDYKNAKNGPGFDVLASFNLAERLDTINEMGLMDEILENPLESLEIIRGGSIKLNYNISKEMKEIGYVKGAI